MSPPERLHVHALRPRVRGFYPEQAANHATDSGFDLYVPEEHTIAPGTRSYKIPLGVSAQPVEGRPHGYMLYARSSIIKTPLRLANAVGIIDDSYRGEIMAVVDHLGPDACTIPAGTRLFQLCMPDLQPFSVRWVDALEESARGAGGFGSTGKQ